MNTQTWLSASPPSKTAGARERAGLTDVPVRLMPMIWTNTSASAMIRPAMREFSALAVMARIV